MKEIQLTKGQCAIIDDDDFERVSKFRWYAQWSEGMKAYRACRSFNGQSIYLHRFIMDAPSGMVVDHINHDMLDNRKENLRLATHAENMRNRRATPKNTSGYKGVSWSSFYKVWKVQIQKDGKSQFIGCFIDPVEAAKAYDVKAKELFGEFAFLNFP
jgi:hypothetical protein